MQTDTLLHRLKPSGHRECPQLDAIRQSASELQTLIDLAHAQLMQIHQPADLRKNSLVDWAGHEPLQLEYHEGPRGDCEFVAIRVRGAQVEDDYFRSDLIEDAMREVASWRAVREAEAREVHADYLHDLQRDRQAEREAA